jgi:hypothetical protein
MNQEHKPLLVPDNAAQELKQAYNAVIEAGVTHLANPDLQAPVTARGVAELYQRAMSDYRLNTPASRLSAERWARTAKHLSGALWHEAKIAYLQDRTSELPYLTDALPEYHLHHETEDGARSLLSCCESGFVPGLIDGLSGPLDLQRCLERGRTHLQALSDSSQPRHELLRAERVKAATQYGRALECALLALESSQTSDQKKAA